MDSILHTVLSLLLCVNPDTAVRALGRADTTALQRDEDMIIARINCHTVRVRVGGYVLQPLICVRVNNAEDWPIGHVPGGEVVAVVAWVVPDLVHTADLSNGGLNRTCTAVDHIHIRRKSLTVVIAAAH